LGFGRSGIDSGIIVCFGLAELEHKDYLQIVLFSALKKKKIIVCHGGSLKPISSSDLYSLNCELT
jgi:hypothetical protein